MPRFKDDKMCIAPATHFHMPSDMVDDINYIYHSSNLTYSEIYRRACALFIKKWKHQKFLEAKRLRQSKRTYNVIRNAIEKIRLSEQNFLSDD